jgi:hypothetical protein
MRILRLSLLIASVLGLVAGASTSWAAGGWTVQSSPNPGQANALQSVSATSSTSAWAVGYHDHDSLIEHYDGSRWATVHAPQPGVISTLYGVKAISSTNAWAVGTFDPKGDPFGYYTRVLIDHFDGTTWTRQVGVSDGSGANYLYAVAAASPTNAWAAGDVYYPTMPPVWSAVIEHYDGTKWRRQTTGSGAQLRGLSAPGTRDVWAVGWYGDEQTTAILHYNGTQWRGITSPNKGTFDELRAVSSASASDIWAVGWYVATNGQRRTLTMHYDGTSWKIVASPNLGTDSYLVGVKTTATSGAWAVGYYDDTAGVQQTLILHYDGTSWATQTSPNVGTFDNELLGVGGDSATGLFAVGYDVTALGPPETSDTLVLNCAC